MKIQIIGMGNVGSAIAFGIFVYKRFGFLSKYNKLYIQDTNEEKACSELLDLRRVKEILSVRDLGIDKTRKMRDVDVYIICAGNRRHLGESDEQLFNRNYENVCGVMRSLDLSKQDSRIIMVTNPAQKFANIYNVEFAGDKCDRISPGENIIKGKGFTNWGIASEVLEML